MICNARPKHLSSAASVWCTILYQCSKGSSGGADIGDTHRYQDEVEEATTKTKHRHAKGGKDVNAAKATTVSIATHERWRRVIVVVVCPAYIVPARCKLILSTAKAAAGTGQEGSPTARTLKGALRAYRLDQAGQNLTCWVQVKGQSVELLAEQT